MYRISKPKDIKAAHDVLQDFTYEQFAGIGKFLMAYNNAEVFIDLLFIFSLNLKGSMTLSITSRINGIDGKIEIVKDALRAISAPEELQRTLSATLGAEGFAEIKRLRDMITHARMSDVENAIGISAPKRGKNYEILLSESALEALFKRAYILEFELSSLTSAVNKLVFWVEKQNFWQIAGANDRDNVAAHLAQERPGIEREIRFYLSQAQQHQRRRLSLPPLPKLPPES